jgi:hypothetical protein
LVKRLGDGRGQVVEVLMGSDRVEEVDPLKGDDLDVVHVAPEPSNGSGLRTSREVSNRRVLRPCLAT